MKELQIAAYAKINLTLDVLGKRDDGYHEVEMIMQSIDLHDLITLQELPVDQIEVSVNHPFVPEDERNIAYRAARLIKDQFQISTGIHIDIRKNIPVAAGLAGGSTDAAGVLTGLNQLWQLNCSKQELMNYGAQLGADVPFCLMGGTALARGIGTELTPITPLPEVDLVLVKPDFGVSTKEVYSKFRPDLVGRRPDLQGMIQAIETHNLEQIKDNLVNVLEDITLYYYPRVQRVKSKMEEVGLYPVLMSGSGPTLFSIADSPESAERYVDKLRSLIDGQVLRTRSRVIR